MLKLTSTIQLEVNEAYLKAFGRTPLRQRLEDIFGEALELSRYTDIKNLREETSDLLGSLIQLVNECDWDIDQLVEDNINKIARRQNQYKTLGRKIKVAILGGAFDPITLGHIELAKFVLDTSKTFDEIWITPCFSHMYNKKMVAPEHRVAMCKIAVRNDYRIKVFEYEIEKKFHGETYHFVKMLLSEDFAKDQYDFSMIIGLDNANTFDQWVNYHDLERMMRFVVAPRAKVVVDPNVNWYLKPPHIYLVGEKPIMESSSTSVRENIGRNDFEAASALVDLKVLDYIKQHNLYQES